MAGGLERQAGVARVWSDALAELAARTDNEDTLLAELEGLVELFDRSPDLERLLSSPAIDDEARRRLVEKAFRGRSSDLLVDALQVLRRKGRLGLLRAVARAFHEEWLRRHRRVEVLVTSAVPLSDALRAEVGRAAARRSGREPILVEKVDPKLLGGLVVAIGDEKFDGSVARVLRRLEHQLLERASNEVIEGKTYFVEAS